MTRSCAVVSAGRSWRDRHGPGFVLLWGRPRIAAKDLGEVALSVEPAVQSDLIDVQVGFIHQGAGSFYPEVIQQICECTPCSEVKNLREKPGVRCADVAFSIYGPMCTSRLDVVWRPCTKRALPNPERRS